MMNVLLVCKSNNENGALKSFVQELSCFILVMEG